jgi:SAM-dependent methyltransferase
MNYLSREVVYPRHHRPLRSREWLALQLGWFPGRCNICGSFTVFGSVQQNLRESCRCLRCGSSNRQRQIARVLLGALRNDFGVLLGSLAEMSRRQLPLAVYSTEASGALHRQLRFLPNYQCSEYFGPLYRSGERVEKIMHQDLMNCSLADASLDVVLSADVLEHIPQPYAAHREVYRILKTGGRHIFTVPFYQTRCKDERRAEIDGDGNIRHLLEPQYHSDPVRPADGILVFTIFSLQMMTELEDIGFETRFYQLFSPWYGILGDNALVFETVKR